MMHCICKPKRATFGILGDMASLPPPNPPMTAKTQFIKRSLWLHIHYTWRNSDWTCSSLISHVRSFAALEESPQAYTPAVLSLLSLLLADVRREAASKYDTHRGGEAKPAMLDCLCRLQCYLDDPAQALTNHRPVALAIFGSTYRRRPLQVLLMVPQPLQPIQVAEMLPWHWQRRPRLLFSQFVSHTMRARRLRLYYSVNNHEHAVKRCCLTVENTSSSSLVDGQTSTCWRLQTMSGSWQCEVYNVISQQPQCHNDCRHVPRSSRKGRDSLSPVKVGYLDVIVH